MRICVFEHPRMLSEKRFNDIANTPLWSCLMAGYAAAALENAGYETRLLDSSAASLTFESAADELLAFQPDLLCINTVYFWENTPVFFKFLSELKEKGFSGHINLFGFFPSLVYREILKTRDGVDSISVGEFEETLVELADALQRGDTLETIQGLALPSCIKDRKERQRSPAGQIDRFVFPKRISLDGVVTILASRGCYNHCSFCPVPSFYNQGALWRGRSPENITKEITVLVDLGVKDFYFADPNFIGPGKAGKKRVIKLMELIRPLGIRFGMETRPGDLDEAILVQLVASGFNSLLMGVESGSEAVLGSIGKSSGPSQASDAIRLCRQYGIEPEIGFLMFVPDSRLGDLRENIQFLMKNGLLDRLDRTVNLLCHRQIVLAGTRGYRIFEEQGRLEKQGIFGFEGRVRFADPRVKQMADLVMGACHTVLRSMSDDRSPVYWKDPVENVSDRVNRYLVHLFFSLLQIVETNKTPIPISEEKSRIADEINRLIFKENA
ncbi:MAG: B12-binding domain-containing radical SAM protein [Desulfobacterales bacterium]|nr:B12-binding domain-containing radical SAM protein [Desulfobacterales bacterium]